MFGLFLVGHGCSWLFLKERKEEHERTNDKYRHGQKERHEASFMDERSKERTPDEHVSEPTQGKNDRAEELLTDRQKRKTYINARKKGRKSERAKARQEDRQRETKAGRKTGRPACKKKETQQ